MRNADEMHKGVGRLNLPFVRTFIQDIAEKRRAARRQFLRRAFPCQGPHMMAARQKLGNQARAQIAGAAGDENVLLVYIALPF